jgi:hypothetical protein
MLQNGFTVFNNVNAGFRHNSFLFRDRRSSVSGSQALLLVPAVTSPPGEPAKKKAKRAPPPLLKI